MNYTTLTESTENRITTITLNCSDRRNALDDVMIKEISDAFASANRNSSSRIVVLTGEGSSFCAGMDLAYLQRCTQLGQAENLEDARNLSRMLQLIHGLKKPVIAMVNGPALGGGCGLASACDFVFAAKEKARLGAPEVRLGFLPAVILLYLIKRMGEGAAREFVLRGDILDATAAKVKGLVSEVVEDNELSSTVYAFAETLARTTSSSSITLTKDLFVRFHEMSEKDALEYAANLNSLTRKTEDFKKGIDSFLKKETLEW
ncbi:MAG: enoyl-CoA hydratase/isomerase family protein [Ignavibacteria bacterium]|nr:enoyl-CoA hydratase/isomerase family protein [Ignavibacteria bacterium]